MTRRTVVTTTLLSMALGGAIVVAANFTPGTVPGTFIGPTSSRTPYVNPTQPDWQVISLLTVGDSAHEVFYEMVGIPDGLGALPGRWEDAAGKYVADNAFMTVFMNHELGQTAGVARRHTQTGAFVSHWSVHLNSLEVKRGEDLIREVFIWDPINDQYFFGNTLTAAQFGRFCSADLPALTAFYNPGSGKGFDGRIFMNGEESGSEGRAFAHIVSGPDFGQSFQLASLGRMSYENSVAHPRAGDTTLVVNLDDSTPGQVYVYVGQKRSTGLPVERAGLLGGSLFGIRVTNGGANYGNAATVLENNGAINGTFTLINVTDVAEGAGSTLQSTSVARGITEFARPEDGAWSTTQPNVFYFVTTGASVGGQTQTSRLYKLTFDNVTNPTSGTIQLVVDSASLVGLDGQTSRSFDNLTVDRDGIVLVQEDPGGSSYIAKTWRIDPATPLAAQQILESDRTRFITGGANFLTQDEESSGIIEVTHLVTGANWYERGRRYFLAVMQAHYAVPSPLVEGGQFYLIVSPKR